jgi:hypothetical protein
MADTINYSKYFTVQANDKTADLIITMSKYSSSSGSHENNYDVVYYRFNTTAGAGEWTQMTRDSNANLSVTVPTSVGFVEFKSEVAIWGTSNNTYSSSYRQIRFSSGVDLSGNIMSLCYSDDFIGKKTFKTEAAGGIFYRLFYKTNIDSAEQLVLPVTHYENVNTIGCYAWMFSHSTIVHGPQIDLRSTESGGYCRDMFSSCSNLIDFTTNLQAGTDNYEDCVFWTKSGNVNNYSGTNIKDQLIYDTEPTVYKSAPILPTAYIGYDRVLTIIKDDKQVNVLKKNNRAFYDLSSMPTDDKANYLRIYNDTAATQTIKFAKSTSSAPSIDIYYLDNQSAVRKLGTTSVNGLTYSLTPKSSLYISSDTSAWASSLNDYNYITGCTYIDGNMQALTNGTSDYKYCNLFSQCKTLKVFKVNHFSPGSSNYACYRMFYELPNLTTVSDIDCEYIGNYAYESIFQGCTSLKSIALKSIERFGNRCFEKAFYGCSSLRKIDYGAFSDTAIASDTFYEWVYGVAASGDFNRIITNTPARGISGIPIGWNDNVTPVIITRQ